MKTAHAPGPAWAQQCYRSWFWITCLVLLVSGGARGAGAAELRFSLSAQFDLANRLYEQGQYTNAVEAYTALTQTGYSNAAVYFNLGNARFKSNERGQAIAAYRIAERLAPRDPAIRFNLAFVQRQVSGRGPASGLSWQNWLSRLTLDEWTLVATGSAWLWFLLLAAREWRPALRRALRGYTATAAALFLLLTACLMAALYQVSPGRQAVVVVPQGIVRYGPLAEAQVYYQLPDGSEVAILNQRRVATGTEPEDWVQIRDRAQRVGWIKRGQIVALR